MVNENILIIKNIKQLNESMKNYKNTFSSVEDGLKQ